jgi:hypothetical protein
MFACEPERRRREDGEKTERRRREDGEKRANATVEITSSSFAGWLRSAALVTLWLLYRIMRWGGASFSAFANVRQYAQSLPLDVCNLRLGRYNRKRPSLRHPFILLTTRRNER